MQRLAGIMALGLGAFVAVLGGIALLIGIVWGGWEAWIMDGASQYNLLMWTGTYLLPLCLTGLALRALGHWLIRTAPPLEEVKLLPPA